MKLTANIALPEGKSDAIFFDDTLRGFALRVRRRRSDGHILKTWAIQYRQHGRQRRMNIGNAAKLTAAQAREKARKLLASVELGGDPQGDKKERRAKDASTLRGVIGEFLSHKSDVKPQTLTTLRRYLEGPLYIRSLHSMPVDKITRRDIASSLLAVTKTNGAATATCLRGALSSLFTWAMTCGLCESSPVIGAVKPPKLSSRDRVLSDSELAAIWNGVGNDDYGKCVKLIILTACRREEIGCMKWTEFSPDGATWTLPKERSKTGNPLTLPVTSAMRAIIDSVPVREGKDHLFCKKGFTDWSNCKRALDERLDLDPWQVRDIRRSASTGMNDIGIQPHVVERILNHAIPGTHGKYNKSVYANEVRDAMLRWSDYVRSLVEGGERKILAYEQRAGV